MNIFLVILLAAIAIVTLLRYKLPIGVAILSGASSCGSASTAHSLRSSNRP